MLENVLKEEMENIKNPYHYIIYNKDVKVLDKMRFYTIGLNSYKNYTYSNLKCKKKILILNVER